jgi:hypothetical protein
MQVKHYLGLVSRAEELLAKALREVADRHFNEYEVREQCTRLAGWCDRHLDVLEPLVSQYGRQARAPGPRQLRAALFRGSRIGGLGLLHDLQDLSLLANAVRTHYTILHQGAIELRDTHLEEIASTLGDDTDRQLVWLCGRIKLTAPQVMMVPPDKAQEAKAAVPRKTMVRLPDSA